jgi:CBS domain containing-hemolysin-like protein
MALCWWKVCCLLRSSKNVSGCAGCPKREGDYQTVGGMVMAYLGHVPAAGDRFEWEGFWFEVLDMDGNRVDKVLVARTTGPALADEAPQG